MSKQYLMIENQGEAAPESFTLLGLSTSRGDEGSIGQFGSGAKHGILVCLRQGIDVSIYCGRTKITPYLETTTINGHPVDRVCFKIGNKTEASSMTLDFGSMDWSDTKMALREFVSNAIDGAQGDWSKVMLDVAKPRAKAGTTRIFVELTSEVKEYWSNIGCYFLHVQGSQGKRILTKPEPSKPRCYRQGVFVREVESRGLSVFNYNFDTSLPIDECRQLDNWRAKDYAAKLLVRDYSATQLMLRRLMDNCPDTWESGFCQYELTSGSSENQLLAAWQSLTVDNAVITDNQLIAEKAERKGHNVVLLPTSASTWVKALVRLGVPRAEDVCCEVERRGHQIVPTQPATQAIVDKVWTFLESEGLTKGKDAPAVCEFVSLMSEEAQLWGYQEGDAIYLHREMSTSIKVILEELAHYVTGATDNSRDFQDYAFRLASYLLECAM